MDRSALRDFKVIEELPFATLWLNHNEDILMISYHKGCTVGLEEGKLVVESVYPYIEAGAIYGITDATADDIEITTAARKYYTDNKSMQLSSAHSVVVKQLAVRLMANFFIKFDRPRMTTKMFNSFRGALDWLESKKLKAAN